MMRWFYVARAAVRSLLQRRVFEDQVSADLRFHLEEATAEYMREGLSPEDARRAALKAFGNPADVMADVREVAMWTWWDRLAQDLRYGLRGFRRTPAFAATTLVSLTLGIGATTAIFSIFNMLLLRPLPVHDPSALFQVLHRGDGGSFESSTYALYELLRRQARTASDAFQVDPVSSVRALVDGRAEALVAQQVTGEYFSVLGIRPALGRLIEPRDEGTRTHDRVVVLDHAYWLRRFGGDPGVLGRTIAIDDALHTIIGVTAREFFGLQVGRRVDVSVPIDGSDEPQFWKSRALIVRFTPGVSRELALAELNVLFHQYLSSDKNLTERARAQGFKSLELAPASSGLPEFRDRYGKPVQAMLVIVVVLLMLGCANLASLFLARAATRQRDLSVCLALGASRARLARQILSEALVISIAGGVLGTLVAWWGVGALTGLLPDFDTSMHRQIGPDRNVLMFSLLATVVTGLGIALAPALFARRIDIRTMLSAGGRTATLGGATFKTLIAVQVALSTVLVVTAMLFVATLSNLRSVPLGFVPEGVLTVTVDADGTDLETAQLGEIHRQMLQQLQALPGVQRASFATIPPLSSNEDGKPISIPGITLSSPDDAVLQVNTVGPGFFEAFGVRILKGRGITASDHQTAPSVAVVSESMAQYFFPGTDPIGRRIGVGRGSSGRYSEIVGVAADVRYQDLRTPPPRMVYVPAFQRAAEEEIVFGVRAAGDPAVWSEPVKRELEAVAPAILIADVKTLVAAREERLVNERVLALLSGGFAGLALLLSAIGIYGLVTYAVTQRTAELGLRIALGAHRLGLLWLVIRGALTIVIVAGLIGATVAFMASSWLMSFLFGIQHAEPWVYSVTMALLVAIGFLAALGPTLRAMHIDPVETLRWQ